MIDFKTKAIIALYGGNFVVRGEEIEFADKDIIFSADDVEAKAKELEFAYNKEQVKSKLKTIIRNKIISGFTFNNFIIKTDETAQRNGNANYQLAQTAMNKAVTYSIDTDYSANSIVLDNDVYYITFNGGKSGADKPIFPIKFQEPVTDNEVTWYKFGLLVGTEKGNKYFTPQDVETMYIQFNFIKTDLLKKYDEYKSKIEVITTNDELEAFKQEVESL